MACISDQAWFYISTAAACGIGIPASIFAIGWAWKHSGLTLD